MINTILGSKIKMSQTFKDGVRVPVTKVKLGPCIVTQVRQDENDMWHIQVGFGEKKVKNISKPVRGHLKAVIKEDAKKGPHFLRDIVVKDEPTVKVGDIIKLEDVVKEGDTIAVTGISKGKGFAGVVKRHGFAGGPKTHGQSDRLRAPGSIGQGTTPGRVYKGKRMAGKMGNDQVTIKNLQILSVNTEKNEAEINGPIPGSPGSLIIIKKK